MLQHVTNDHDVNGTRWKIDRFNRFGLNKENVGRIPAGHVGMGINGIFSFCLDLINKVTVSGANVSNSTARRYKSLEILTDRLPYPLPAWMRGVSSIKIAGIHRLDDAPARQG